MDDGSVSSGPDIVAGLSAYGQQTFALLATINTNRARHYPLCTHSQNEQAERVNAQSVTETLAYLLKVP